jgi:hypothetical protein
MLRIITNVLGSSLVLAQFGCANPPNGNFPYVDRVYENAMVCARVTVSADGQLKEAIILRSTGDAHLNARVRYELSEGKFTPGQVKGKPVESTSVKAFVYRPFGTVRNRVSGPEYTTEQADEFCRDIPDLPLDPSRQPNRRFGSWAPPGVQNL